MQATADFIITPVQESKLKNTNLENIPFGKYFTDHMLEVDCINGQWQTAEIKPYQPLIVDPSLAVFHYGQAIFEGIKAYKSPDGAIQVFRPYDNFNRFNLSAERMQMPQVPEEIFMGGLKKLILLDKDWVPEMENHSLYIRPFMISTDQAIGVKPRRTIRIALWGGEEQGLIGSRNYVKNNIADPATMTLKPQHEKISAYYNLDNGSGRIRGIYLQGNSEAASVFTMWLKSFGDKDAYTVTLNNTGGTDHLAFDGVGIPGFQFIQDPLEYDTRTHHTNMDTYDHLVPDDLKQAAQIVAYFVYNTAQRDEKIPRKELPKPRGESQRGF